MISKHPIGLFDSGLGGLTVLRSIHQLLPNEDIVYLGDTARVPYGTRSTGTVQKYAKMCTKELLKHNIKVLVVACNTVSAVALSMLEEQMSIPVLGVIVPGAKAGVEATKTNRISVVATEGTIESGAYKKAISALNPQSEMMGVAAPLFVPLVEEGWVEGEVPENIATRYLENFRAFQPDTLVLGCTHYPLLFSMIEKVAQRELNPHLTVVDSAQATATDLKRLLEEKELLHPGNSKGKIELLVTDLVKRFANISSRFLGGDVEIYSVEQVDL